MLFLDCKQINCGLTNFYIDNYDLGKISIYRYIGLWQNKIGNCF